MTTYKIVLDPEHRYFVDGERKPGFSEICGDLGVTKENRFYTADGREEGVVLHEWLLFLAQGKEPAEDPDPRIAGRVEGIRKFLSDTQFKFQGGETPLYHALGFCTTPDIYGYIGNFSWVIDAKRGQKMKFHSLQTAAQKMALLASGFNAQKRGGLYLRDGDYRLDEHLDRDDEHRWRTLVAGYYAKTFYLEKGAHNAK